MVNDSVPQHRIISTHPLPAGYACSYRYIGSCTDAYTPAVSGRGLLWLLMRYVIRCEALFRTKVFSGNRRHALILFYFPSFFLTELAVYRVMFCAVAYYLAAFWHVKRGVSYSRIACGLLRGYLCKGFPRRSSPRSGSPHSGLPQSGRKGSVTHRSALCQHLQPHHQLFPFIAYQQ